jgi:hypothetical protein
VHDSPLPLCVDIRMFLKFGIYEINLVLKEIEYSSVPVIRVFSVICSNLMLCAAQRHGRESFVQISNRIEIKL